MLLVALSFMGYQTSSTDSVLPGLLIPPGTTLKGGLMVV